MKRLRIVLLLIGVAGVLAGAIHWASRPRGFATPQECLEAYREACLTGDVARYLACLGEPLRSEARQRFADERALADALQTRMQDLKGWSQAPEADDGAVAHVLVDEVRVADTRRSRFRLERSAQGWRIVGVEPAKVIATSIPYGTHVSQGTGEPAREKEEEP